MATVLPAWLTGPLWARGMPQGGHSCYWHAQEPPPVLQGTNELRSIYWLGLRWDEEDFLWLWQDGDDASNGEVLNQYPYAHW